LGSKNRPTLGEWAVFSPPKEKEKAKTRRTCNFPFSMKKLFCPYNQRPPQGGEEQKIFAREKIRGKSKKRKLPAYHDVSFDERFFQPKNSM